MTICSKCGVELNDDARYCKACGSGHGARGETTLKEEKKARVLATERTGTRIAVILGAAIAVLVIAWIGYVLLFKSSGPSLRSAMKMKAAPGMARTAAVQALTPVAGAVKIPLAALTDGKAHFFSYASGALTVRFFALRKADGSIGVALDACNACYRAKLGYRQDGDQVICNNCGMAFRPEDIGIVTGGCNPIPLSHQLTGDAVVVKTTELDQAGKYF